MIPQLKQTITIVLLLIGIISYSQRLQNEKYELILTELNEYQTNFDQKLKMSQTHQSYYEGVISVTNKKNGNDKDYKFFFSVWNKKCKSFLVKDIQANIIEPKVFFNGKTAFIKNENGSKASIDLKGTLQVEKYILSCMLFWLNQKDINNGTVVAK